MPAVTAHAYVSSPILHYVATRYHAVLVDFMDWFSLSGGVLDYWGQFVGARIVSNYLL